MSEIQLKRISELPASGGLTGSEIFAFVIGGVTVRGTLSQISAYINNGAIPVGGGSEITNSTNRTQLQLNSNYVNPGDSTDKYYPNYTGTAITGQSEHDYFIGVDSVTGLKYLYLFKNITTGSTTVLSIVRESLDLVSIPPYRESIFWNNSVTDNKYRTTNPSPGSLDGVGSIWQNGQQQAIYPQIDPLDATKIIWDLSGLSPQSDGIEYKTIWTTATVISSVVDTRTLADILFVNGSAGGNKITNLTDPTSAQDAATKAYIDTAVAGGGGSALFTSNIIVSLSGGKKLGKYSNGDTIPSNGKTAEEVFNLIAIEDIYPTYNIATNNINTNQPVLGEVGEALSNIITATFAQNDAGALTSIRIQKNGADITPNGTSSPFSKTDSVTRILGSVTYQAFANYNAGLLKNITPGNTPDTRTAAIRNANAPQAAENNFASAIIYLTGLYKIFFGDFATAPTTSNVRSANNSRFTNSGNAFVLNTGTSNKIFAIWMPNSNSLVNVFDATVNADISGQFIQSSLSVNDAGGTAVSGKLYTMSNAVVYSANHTFNVTIS